MNTVPGQLEVEVEVGRLHLGRVPADVVAGREEASLDGLADESVLGLKNWQPDLKSPPH